ncbi:MAG TPA: hypothetical protein DDW98_10670 [Gammaproteobacteria bacterium]|nr:hypothetical protein [Gammaproteobacteria bacterium]
MSVDQYQREILRRQEVMAKLQRDKGAEMAKVSDENRKALAATNAASRASSPSIAGNKLREAQRHHANAALHQKKVSEIERKIGQEQAHIISAQKRLEQAERYEQKQFEARQKREQQANDRRMSVIDHKLHRHDRMHAWAKSAIQRLENPPEVITVLFLASNPLDENSLRLDEEARAIQQRLRLSQHRDSVRFETRWAVRPADVLQALNECRPRIVHFSGHGTQSEDIVFQDDLGQAKLVSKAALVQTMAACTSDVQMVFFNTCHSQGQAMAVVEHVLASIGMSASVGDDAARTFAAQFYSAIGFGRSVRQAFEQAKAALMLESIPEEDTPVLHVATGVDASELFFVSGH